MQHLQRYEHRLIDNSKSLVKAHTGKTPQEPECTEKPMTSAAFFDTNVERIGKRFRQYCSAQSRPDFSYVFLH